MYFSVNCPVLKSDKYLMTGEEIFKRGSGWEVSEWCHDSEDKTFYIWSHNRTLVLYRPKPAEQRKSRQQINEVISH